MTKRKRGFTLIELIAVLVILAILALIVTPLVMNIIKKAKDAANKRSVDAYGRSVELAIASYLLETGAFPTDLSTLNVEYTGKTVVCNVMQMKENGGLYLSECTVNNKDVKDSHADDGWYHYGTRDLTNEEYVDMYGDALKTASLAYYTANNQAVSDYTTLTVDYKGKPVSCDVTVNYDGTIYMTNCKVNNVSVTSETEEDGYYHYGNDKSTGVKALLSNVNNASVTSYTDGNTGEMYTFTHPATTQQNYEVTDYRYIGANPNNYVTFNNELWRIIGVFTVEDGNGNQEQRIKIVRNEKLSSNMAWDSNGVNEWNNASLQKYLNGTNDGDYYNGLSETAKSMIATTKYYLGGSNTSSGGAETYYSWERGTTVYSGRSTSWTGKIALMYPSDYSYTYALGVDNTCYTDGTYNGCGQSSGKTNGWIYNTNSNSYQWLLSPYSDGGLNAFHLVDSGYVYYGSRGVAIRCGVRPSLYLISDIKIDSGEGTEQSPYQLKL